MVREVKFAWVKERKKEGLKTEKETGQLVCKLGMGWMDWDSDLGTWESLVA